MLKKGHQGLLKLHIPLRGFPLWGKNEAPKGVFYLKQKNNM